MTSKVSGNGSIDTFAFRLFPKEWMREHTDNIQNNITIPMDKVSKENIQLQFEANSRWKGTQ
jgi:hypothetical protein